MMWVLISSHPHSPVILERPQLISKNIRKRVVRLKYEKYVSFKIKEFVEKHFSFH